MIGPHRNESLQLAAASPRERPAWSDYAAHCEDRERGLRPQALAHLDRFLATARSWSFDDRREFVDWLCWRRAEHQRDGYGLIPYPLAEELVVPTLNEWTAQASSDASPHRLLGLFFAGTYYAGLRAGLCPTDDTLYSHLHAALRADPSDQLARIRLIELAIGGADYSCHYLPHFYIVDPDDDIAGLAEAAEHLARVRDEATAPGRDRSHLAANTHSNLN
jgi:hypothetical protein